LQLLRDQKDTLDGVFDFVKSERELSTSYIKELHAALLRSQDTTEGLDANGRHIEVPLIRGAWKEQENYPVRDGVRYLYCPPEHVASEMQRLIEIHACHIEEGVPSELQAAWLHHRFTQIHPFQDGNGRVARALASLVLVKDGLFPLVITRDDKPRYIDALEAADKGNLRLLVDVFVRSQATQFRKASAVSEVILIEEDVQSALDGLLQAADRVAKEKVHALNSVFDHAATIEQDLQNRLQALVPTINDALGRVTESANVFVNRSSDQTDFYYRSQIIDNAKHRFNYFADTSVYRSWVSMHMHWARRGQLVFTIHGIGKPFNGSLICSPFLEFKDADDEGESRVSLVPVAEEGFVFFYTEQQERLMVRFRTWRENVLKIFIKELSQNL
jgi:fido (protein-threonine AMPylation protein)